MNASFQFSQNSQRSNFISEFNRKLIHPNLYLRFELEPSRKLISQSRCHFQFWVSSLNCFQSCTSHNKLLLCGDDNRVKLPVCFCIACSFYRQIVNTISNIRLFSHEIMDLINFSVAQQLKWLWLRGITFYNQKRSI